MNNQQSHVLETLRQVQVFLDANAAVVGPTIASSRRNLDDVVAQLAAHATSQEGSNIGSRGETARQRALRSSLRQNHMRPIAEVAKQKLRDVPEFHALTMPPSNATSAQLVARASAMADAAQSYEQVFKDVGLPDDFIPSLRSTADDVSKSIDDRKQHTGKRSGATAGLSAEERRGRSMLRLLDALVVPRLGSKDALLAEWRSARRVSRKTGPASGTVVAATPITGTTQPPATVSS